MKQISGVYNAPAQHWVGDGFPVRSLFSYSNHGHQLSPFLLLDHAGPYEFAAAETPRGVGEHPHRGFETITIVYEGEIAHRDSTGAAGKIGVGDVQWMTAASGILHEEFHSEAFTRRGGTLEMVQLWVNLPAAHKMSAPSYQNIMNADIPLVTLDEGAGTVRVIAGGFGGERGPARTHTPMDVWDLRLRHDQATTLDFAEGHSAAMVVLHGTLLVNDQQVVREGQLVIFDRAAGTVKLEANVDATALVLAGEPIKEPVVGQGPFVMNTQEEIKQAMRDFGSGRFGQIPA